MRFIADLHIHSYYSRATSKQLNLEHLNKWAQIKGLRVIATGDITHPKWLEEMKTKLCPAENGLFRLKKKFADITQPEVPPSCTSDVSFILSGEISNIYKKAGRVRKNHHVVFFPSFEATEKFQATLDRVGNIRSDGRPILGMNARDLLEIVLDTDDRGFLIPAHIWTPWFSVLGSKSGFDSIEDCFEDLSPHIFALETGLSSDPPMNWRLSKLDPYSLVSNSDAHSPAKLAREANVFLTQPDYDKIFHALKNKSSREFWGTIEFFPEEGKYHMDGHRKCGKMMFPSETMSHGGLCPVCGKPATLGVSYRVEELADRPAGTAPANAKPFLSLIPLPEVLSEVTRKGPSSQAVHTLYFSVLKILGSELNILMDIPLEDIENSVDPLTAEAIGRMRKGKVTPQPGYDGEYGVIRIFTDRERDELRHQGALFSIQEFNRKSEPPVLKKNRSKPKSTSVVNHVAETRESYGLNPDQLSAVEHRGVPLVIQAGPGTGKTRTLTHRLSSLVKSGDAEPENILAITFTNKAAGEMKQRLVSLLGKRITEKMTINTFHAFGATFLRNQKEFMGRDRDFCIIDTTGDNVFIKALERKSGAKITTGILEQLARLKGQQVFSCEQIPKEILEQNPQNVPQIFKAYEQLLIEWNGVDYEDLVSIPLRILNKDPEKRKEMLRQFNTIAVDEFQDINQTQYALFRLLAIAARDVCIIGDPDQAIYGFRGADRRFFMRFKEDFPHAESIRLSRNYRSAQNILSASLQMLGTEERAGNRIWSDIEPTVKVHIFNAPTDRAEAEFIVHQIEQKIGGTSYFSIDTRRVDERGLPQDFAFSDFAILLRTKRLAPPIIEALARSGMPFESIGDSRISSQPAIRLVVAALRHVTAKSAVLPADELSQEILKDYPSTLKFLREMGKPDPHVTVSEWIQKIWQHTSFESILGQEESKNILNRLMQLAVPFENRLDSYIDSLLLQRESDALDEHSDRIRLLTLHASKGLEFNVVFIAGCEENIIPFQIGDQKTDIEEERRVLYVGMTRAKRFLYLTRAKTRVMFGQRKTQSPSRFLAPISTSLLEKSQRHGRWVGDRQLSLHL